MARPERERRQAPRYPVSAAVELGSARGHTRDVSTQGVFIETGGAFQLGTRVRFVMVFDGDDEGPRRARCEGEVVRVEREGQRAGIAVRIIEHAWEDEAAGAAP